jgi:putative addiction module CopG family antidote
MSISLSPELERQITERVASADEVVRQAMQLLSQRDEQEASNLVLRAKIQEGIDDLENGRHSPLEDVVARLRERYSVPLAI